MWWWAAVALAGEPLELSFTLVGEPPQMRVSEKLASSDARRVDELGWDGPIDEFSLELPAEQWVQLDVETKGDHLPKVWIAGSPAKVSKYQPTTHWSGSGGKLSVHVGAQAADFKGSYTLVLTPLTHAPLQPPTGPAVSGSAWVDGRHLQASGLYCTFRDVEPVPEGQATWELSATGKATLQLGVWGVEGFEPQHTATATTLGGWTQLQAALPKGVPAVVAMCADRKGKVSLRVPEAAPAPGGREAREPTSAAPLTAAIVAKSRQDALGVEGFAVQRGIADATLPQTVATLRLQAGDRVEVFAATEERQPPSLRAQVAQCKRACREWADARGVPVEEAPEGTVYLNLYAVAALGETQGVRTASWSDTWPNEAGEARIEAVSSTGRAPQLVVASKRP